MTPEQINKRAAELQQQINDRLNNFQPTGRFADMERDEARYLDPFLNERRQNMVFSGGKYEAEAIAEQIAGDQWEIRIMETIGGEQRYRAVVMRYLGPVHFPD